MSLKIWKLILIFLLSCSQAYAQKKLTPSQYFYGDARLSANLICLAVRNSHFHRQEYSALNNFDLEKCIQKELEDLKPLDKLGELSELALDSLQTVCRAGLRGRTVNSYVSCLFKSHAIAEQAGGIPDISRFHIDVQAVIPGQCTSELRRYDNQPDANIDGYVRCLHLVTKDWDKAINITELSKDLQFKISRACRPFDPKEYSACVSKQLHGINASVTAQPRKNEPPKLGDRKDSPKVSPPRDLAVIQRSSGTAFAIAPELLITNQHVISNCGIIEIHAQGHKLRAEIVDSDAKIDLALLRVFGLKRAYARLRSPQAIRLGETVTVFGYPLAGSLSSDGNFTTGVVSALRGFKNAAGEIQISAPVQPGNSGGPLMDSSGNIVGVVQGRLELSRSAATTSGIPQNVNFAISLEALATYLTKNNVAFQESAASKPLDMAAVAELAQSFTYYLECRGES